MNRIKEITFTFENCEQITIPGKYIGCFFVNGIYKRIARIACNAIKEMDICSSFGVEIHKDANVPYSPFGDESMEETTFDRFLRWDDITGIDFVMTTDAVYYGAEEMTAENSKTYSFYADWDSSLDYEENNRNQMTALSELGHLYILIDADSSISEVWDNSEINDESYDITFDLCDVGNAHYEAARERFMRQYGNEDDADPEPVQPELKKGVMDAKEPDQEQTDLTPAQPEE